jgi:hypothetical protein
MPPVDIWHDRAVFHFLTDPTPVTAKLDEEIERRLLKAAAGTWRVDLSALWIVLLLGVGLAFVIEWRTVGRNSNA